MAECGACLICRTIRYYSTLGLIDRPAEMRGRTAFYGRRHLLQLVAIKRLQAKGQSLANLQQQLLGLSDMEIAAIARLPAQPSGPKPPRDRRSAAFWTESAAPAEKQDPVQSASSTPLQGVELSDSVTLLLHPARALEADDLEAIRVVAAPLLKLLQTRRLL